MSYETWLNNSHTDSEIAIYGYNLERCDRTEGHGGGLAVYVHESVTYKRCPDLESDAVEALVIRVTIPHAKPVFVAIVYRPPSAPVAWYGVFDDFMDRLCAQECELVVMGDMNIDILDGLNTAPSSSVPRRLATKKSKQVAVGSANKLVARHHSSCGVCAKRVQVTISSHSTSDTHRCRISSRPRSDVPTDEPCSKVRRQDRNSRPRIWAV